MCADGCEHMDAGKYICVGIGRVQNRNQLCKYVLISVQLRPKIQTVRENGTDQQADGHAAEQVSGQPVKIRFRALKQEKQYSSDNINKPQQIGNDEVFNKRNPVIQMGMQYRIIARYGLLQIKEPREIDEYIEQHPYLAVFL